MHTHTNMRKALEQREDEIRALRKEVNALRCAVDVILDRNKRGIPEPPENSED